MCIIQVLIDIFSAHGVHFDTVHGRHRMRELDMCINPGAPRSISLVCMARLTCASMADIEEPGHVHHPGAPRSTSVSAWRD
jgi:hypothetical protein